MSYEAIEYGTKYTLDYEVFIKDKDGNIVSPFHDIPCYPTEDKSIVNMVVEVERWSNAKMEINKEKKLNPIVQDQKKNKPRFVHNCFPHHGYIWNYGAIPQTWEDPDKEDSHTQCKGDDDPLDIVEIGSKIHKLGSVIQVKVLGVMAMIDEGETDWKVIGIDVNDPKAAELNDVSDIDKVFPGLIAATNEWFRIYKIPAGKPENTFAFDGECKNKDFAMGIIEETGADWKTMMLSEAGHGDLSRMHTQADTPDLKDSAEFVDQARAKEELSSKPALTDPAPLDPSVDEWHYITL
jgi:inorganic pyrophosphatase